MDSLSRLVCRVRSVILLGGVIGLAGGTWVRAEILNDGTTTNRLVRLANSEETAFGNITALRVDAAGAFLVAEQIDLGFLSPFPALRSAWFSGSAAVTGAVYRVSAEFRPAAANAANQGGVIGWLNTSASNAIVLKVVPGDGGTSLPFSFQLSHVDFTGTTPDVNENLNYLFDLDGEPAANSFQSAWSDPTGYQPGEFGQFELEFTAPTAEQVSVVTNATVTALVTAKVFQGAGGGTPAQIGRTIELLTSLPVPPPDRHRVAYYGVWSSFFPGNVIGYYRNLTAEGQVALNNAPSVQLSQPTPGTTNTAPATFSLVADASDSDGTIAAVEFFEGANSLGRVTAPPFVWSWSGVGAGSYQLTAVATDNLGEATTSEPVGVTVVPFSAPTLNVEVEGDTIHLAWSGSGFQLQYKTSVGAAPWVDVPNTTEVSQIDMKASLGAQYFRLVESGAPSGPSLSVAVAGTDITVSWPPATVGYRLQSNVALGGADWTELPTTGNTFTAPIAGGARFYRLVQ